MMLLAVLQSFMITPSAYLDKVFRVQSAGQELTVWAAVAQRPLIHQKAHASRDNVHLATSLLSVETDGISSRQHIMYTCRCYIGASADNYCK